MPEMHQSHDWKFMPGRAVGYTCRRCSTCTCHDWALSSKRCTFLGEEKE